MGQLSHPELTLTKKVLGWLRAELNLWHVKVSVHLYHSCSNSNSSIRTLIPTLPLPLFPLPPFPLSSRKNHHPQEQRRGGPPSTTFGARADALAFVLLTAARRRHRAPCSKVSLPFFPFLVLLTNSYSSLTQALRATPAPPHAQALLRRSGTFFFCSFSIH